MYARRAAYFLLAGFFGLDALAGTTALAQSMSADAYQHATEAYRAIESKDLERALREARAALARQPASAGTRRLLAEVLISRKEYDLARQVIDGAIERGVVDGPLYMTRGYLDLDTQQPQQAVGDFQKALDATSDDPAKQRPIRLQLADAALQAKQPNDVLAALEPLHDDSSPEVASRLGQAYSALGRNQEAAAAFGHAAAGTADTQQQRAQLIAQARAENAGGSPEEAKKLVEQLASQTQGCDLDLAYLLIAAKDNEAALKVFDGACKDSLEAHTQIDAGNTAVHLVKNEEAIDHFKSALDDQYKSPAPGPLTPETVYGVRREVDTLSREWGVNASYAYFADRPDRDGGSVSQALAELYWQPPDIGYRDGSVFQVFGRVSFNALQPGEAGLSLNGTEGEVGARYKPFGSANLVLEGEGLIALGDRAYNDFLLRAAYSDGFGTDLDPVNSWWLFAQGYVEGDWFVVNDFHEGYADARSGATAYLSDGRPEWTGSIFADLAGYYDDTEQRRFSAGIGPGIGVKYWFRESDYRAPASSAELDLIYRVKLTPSDRAGGLLLQLNLAY